jgi:hypothetical protein
MKKIYIAIIVVIVAAAGFFGGMEYQKRKTPTQMFTNAGQRGANGQRGQFIQRGNMQGVRPVSGEIISQDENSITVKSEDGSSKIVILSETTTINKASQGTKEDLKTGEKVAIFGKENSDGSVTAQNVQLNPQQRMIFNGPTPSQSPNQ